MRWPGASDSRVPLPPDLLGLNVPDFLDEAVRERPDATLVLAPTGALTYQAFADETDRAASAWQHLGIEKGDRVAFLADNSPEFLVAWLGLAKTGGVLVAMNTRFTSAEVAVLLEHSRPKLALADAPHAETLRRAAAPTGVPVLDLGGPAATTDFLSLPRLRSYDRVDLGANDVISFVYTSGTTGRPKAVMQTHGNLVLTGQAFGKWLALERGSRIYCCLPLYHANAQVYQTMGAIGMGGSVALATRFSASGFWDEIAAVGANAFGFIGAMIVILLKQEPHPREREHELRVAWGIPAFSEEQRLAIEERFGLSVMSGFGMSETSFGLGEDRLGERRSGSVGKPRLHPDRRLEVEARIVDDEGMDVADDRVGELLLRNPMTMLGYFDDRDETDLAIRDGWLHTGDYARRDAEGFYYFVDRKKDLIRRRGENVSSREVEATLDLHPGVREAAVVATPSELTDDEIVAFVVAVDEPFDPVDLVEWCAERLADFKVPRFVRFLDELPKTATHKVQKQLLRAELADRSLLWDREAELPAERKQPAETG